MNRIVKSFNRWQGRRKPATDGLVIDETRVAFDATKINLLEVKTMGSSNCAVSINKSAVQELAMHGPQDRVEDLYRMVAATCKELGVKPSRAFKKQKRFTGGRPCNHDILRWLQDLPRQGDEADLKFLSKLFATLRGRAHYDVVAKTEG